MAKKLVKKKKKKQKKIKQVIVKCPNKIRKRLTSHEKDSKK